MNIKKHTNHLTTDDIKISVVMIDSRSEAHPDWIQTAVDSVKVQSVGCELIVVNNTKLRYTIGECWNRAVQEASGEYILFMGDDDWIGRELSGILLHYALTEPNYVMWTTFMTYYEDKTGNRFQHQQIWTGMWKKDYLLKHKFNEGLAKGVDREYIEETVKRGDRALRIDQVYSYFYRKHEDHSCAGDVTFEVKDVEYYITAPYRSFIDPLIAQWKREDHSVYAEAHFNPLQAKDAKVIWCEWANENAVKVADFKTDAIKILRVHSYEAYTNIIHYIKWEKFDKVIFVADHVKAYVEHQVGKIPNAVVIPIGIDLDAYTLRQPEDRNNKVCCAGEISRKKGIGELIFIAREFPEFEFHVAGKYNEEDVALYINDRLPKNMVIHPYSYDLNKWLDNYTYYINTSLREGNPVTVMQAMAKGLKPMIYNWIGSEDIYGVEYIFRDTGDLHDLLYGSYTPKKYRKMIEKNHDFKTQYQKIRAILNP